MNTPINEQIFYLLKEKLYPFTFIHLGEISDIPLNIPTIAEVMMWIYEKYGIWIYVRNFKTLNFCAYILKDGDPEYSITTGFNSPTEAYEAAIEYTLKNLISNK